ncbi:MAG: hypothetical protein U5J98_07315 [Halobacteriales archaeon]|nr:hypothetical protein [Halobacteriales archaeon]
MEYPETLKWTGVYLGLWLLAAVLGGAVLVGGIALGGLAGLGAYQLTPFSLRLALYPTGGLVVMALGLVVFKVGTAAALIHVVVNATEDRLPAALDTEGVKSDILSVLDDRLAEMHDDLRETRRLASGQANDPGDFEFE